ncbi:MAG: aminotransferase class I/II-fold pyridoxal phosphate-dependent enzyme [Rhodobiaceae bacterium]|nr:aminotransferase class I/II-fold pyridoxal phosphate-dependent enzyme [Rhodobiaceae bacterium]
MARSLIGDSPFQRLAALLEGIPSGMTPINLSLGEPHHRYPEVAARAIAADLDPLGAYPAAAGTPAFRQAIANWACRRFELGHLDPQTEITALCGSREGLFLAAVTAALESGKKDPVALLPNPFYQSYGAGIVAAGLSPVLLDAHAGNNHLPDIENVAPDILERTVLAFFASPSNPAGTVASAERLRSIVDTARRHDFYLFADECYSELYQSAPPAGALSVSEEGNFSKVCVFNSLSKRSNLPGLRCGFAAGDPAFIKALIRMRNLCGPQVPVPLQNAAIAAYGDEVHVAENRRLYAAKFDLADEIIGTWPGYRRPEAGFFLWLDVGALGGGESFALRAWQEAGLRFIPGAYLGRRGSDGVNPGDDYVRIALVDDLDLTETALARLARLLN